MIGRPLLIDGYGASVRVDVPYRMDVAALRGYVAPELTISDSDEMGPPDLLLTCWNGVFHLVLGERRYGPYRTEENAFRGVANGIHFLIGKRSPMIFFHAGAVELDGNAVVFLGRGRWGKSALVESLVDQGCGYLSDEYAVVSPEGTVFPFSKPIMLRHKLSGVSYHHHPGAGAPGGFPCSTVVVTRFEDGNGWTTIPVTPELATLQSLQTALRCRDETEQVRGALAALVDGAACYEGVLGYSQPELSVIRDLAGVGNIGMEISS